MKRISSFFEGILFCLRNKISEIDLRFNYLPYEKFIGILADETMMAWEFGISESIGITPEVYYIELMLALSKKGLVSFFHKGGSGRIDRVYLYRKKGLYDSFKGLYVNRKKFSDMIKSQKALYDENLKVVERMTSLEKDIDLVEKYKNYRDNYNPKNDTFSAKSDDPKKDSLMLYEYIKLKSRMKELSEKLFLNFTPMN